MNTPLHFSVFKEGNKWHAQVLSMPDERVLRFASRSTRPEAQALLSGWKRDTYKLLQLADRLVDEEP